MARIARSSRSRRIALEVYAFTCCAVCGLTVEAALDVAHLNQDPTDDAPDNLVFLCKTHHRMFDCGLYPLDGIKLLRDHWQLWHAAGARPDHAIYMKDAGQKSGQTRRRRAAARKAVKTRETRATSGLSVSGNESNAD